MEKNCINILVIDDEQHTESLFVQKFAKEIENKEFDFTFFNQSVEALDFLKNNLLNFLVVLIDLQMPHVSGFEIMEKLSQENIKSVVVTAYSDLENLKKAMNAGAYDFCVKPIVFLELKQTIIRAATATLELRKFKESDRELGLLQKELSISSNLQQSILPHQFEDNEYVDLASLMQPAVEIGGDFYDYWWINKDKLAIAIADVSGKNISAALYMAMVKTLLRAMAEVYIEPQKTITKVNKSLASNNSSSMFTTAIYGVLDITLNTFTYVNAGHTMPILVRNHEASQLIKANGCALGIFDQAEYVTEIVNLQNQDRLIFYTDGISEAFNLQLEDFKVDRLIDSVNATLKKNPQSKVSHILNHIIEDIKNFVKEAPQSDDITALALDFKQTKLQKNIVILNLENRLPALTKLPPFIAELSKNFNLQEFIAYNLELCLDELLTNIITYGYTDLNNEDEIKVTIENQDQVLKIELIDRGKEFNLLESKDPQSIKQEAKDRPIGGLGIYFVKQIMNNMSYSRDNNSNILTMYLSKNSAS